MVKEINIENKAAQAGLKEMKLLKKYFPQCFTLDGKFDVEKFRTALPEGTKLTDETTGFNFLGKNYARMLYNMDTTTVIRPDEEHNAKPENRDSQNVYISGDNLDALQHLVKSYSGQIKVIYIDPPYNTGDDGFAYNDKFNFTPQDLVKKLGVTEERAQRLLDMTTRKSASHAAWLTFMLPRLEFARDLLSENGLIFISIDDNEQTNLSCLCNEVFGESNFMGNVIWKNVTDNNPTQITCEHEYIFCYAKNKELITKAWKSKESAIKDLLIKIGSELNSQYKGDDLQSVWKKWFKEHKSQLGPLSDYKFIDEGGVFTGSRSVHNPGKNGYYYDIIHPVTGKPCTAPLMGYRFPEESMRKLINEGRILFGEDETKLVEIKVYASEYQDKFASVYELDGRTAANELRVLFPEHKQIFKNPKPTLLIEHILSFMEIEDEPIVDFFGGSSTTAHAILNLNKDGNSRKFILVQWQEPCKEDSEAYKAGYRTIDEIGMERIKRAAAKIREDNPLFAGDLGFRHYTLVEPEQNTLDKIEEFNEDSIFSDKTILSEFGVETVLRTWIVRDHEFGLTLDATEVDMAGYKAYLCGDYLYMIHPDDTFTEASMVALMDKYNGETQFNPSKIVLFGYSFGATVHTMLASNLQTLNTKGKSKCLNVNIDLRY